MGRKVDGELMLRFVLRSAKLLGRIREHLDLLLEALPGYLADQHDLHDLPALPGVTDAGGTGRGV